MGGFIYWILVGLIAGWLAGKVMKGGGYGVVADIVLGILGGIVGGWGFGMLGLRAGGLVGSLVVAVVGAVIVVWITRRLNKASGQWMCHRAPSRPRRVNPARRLTA